MKRAFEPGEPGVANDAGWPAGVWDDPVHELPKGGLLPAEVILKQGYNLKL